MEQKEYFVTGVHGYANMTTLEKQLEAKATKEVLGYVLDEDSLNAFVKEGLIEYQAKLCADCKRLKPVEIRKEMRYVPHIQMGRVHISLQEVKGYGW
ncbi:MAG: hypothetical protein II891_06910 [Bacteroidales bacterium]|nr:hypothetical protein [Bacteroidales bacterium]